MWDNLMNSEPTEGQLKVIGYIENNLGISFKGKTRDHAQKFISQNIEDSKSNVNITKKQKEAIESCCYLLSDLKFEGNTKVEATEFLKLHIEDARKEVAKRIREEIAFNASLTAGSVGTPYFDNMPKRMTTALAYSVFGIPFAPDHMYDFMEGLLDLEEDIEDRGIYGLGGSLFIPD